VVVFLCAKRIEKKALQGGREGKRISEPLARSIKGVAIERLTKHCGWETQGTPAPHVLDLLEEERRKKKRRRYRPGRRECFILSLPRFKEGGAEKDLFHWGQEERKGTVLRVGEQQQRIRRKGELLLKRKEKGHSVQSHFPKVK